MRSKFQLRKLCERALKVDLGLDLQALPTVCLLAADDFQDELAFKRLIANVLAYDCRYFMTYGLAAEILHDMIDEVIIDLGLGCKGIPTANHADEPVDDAAYFFVNATAPGENCVQYFFGFDDMAALEELTCAIKSEVQRFHENSLADYSRET